SEARAAVGRGDVVAGHAVVGKRHGGGRGTVVDLALGRGGHRAALLGDAGRGGESGGRQDVVGGIRTREGEAGAGDGLARTRVLVGERGRAAGQAHVRCIAAEHTAEVARGDGSSGGAVVHLVAGCEAAGDRLGRDGEGGHVVGDRVV